PPLAGRGGRPGRAAGRGPGLPLERRRLATRAGRRPGPGRADRLHPRRPPPPPPAAPAPPRGLASLFPGFAGPDDLVRAGLLSGFDPDAVDLLRAAFARPRPRTARVCHP